MMRQTFSMGERSGLQAGHFNTWILLLRSHDVVIDTVCGLALSCWKMHGLPWKRQHLDGSICCSRTWKYFSALMPMPPALMQPHIIRDAGFWTERWSHLRLFLLSLVQMTRHPSFPKRTSHFDLSDYRTVFHFATVHFKWAFAQRICLRLGIMFGYSLFFDL